MAVVILTVIIGKVHASMQFSREVKALFSEPEDIPEKRVTYSQLQSLPDPVQRYFKHVMKEEQPYIKYIRLKHKGQFKTDIKKDWIDIEGEQYFTTEQPGFIWRGITSTFTAKDMYISGKGKLAVSLFGLINIAGGEGEKYDQGELLRWLAESVWFPTNLLPQENLQWVAIDKNRAQLNFNYGGYALSYLVTFNDLGEITELQTQRYMGEGSLETWVGKVSGYKKINGILVPTQIEAIYKLAEGDYSYAKFDVREIEYGIPEKY